LSSAWHINRYPLNHTDCRRGSPHDRAVALGNLQSYPPGCVAVWGGNLPNSCACIVWALVAVGGGGLLSCGADKPPETCLEEVISYTGSKSGTAYSRVASNDGGRSLFFGSTAASIRFLVAFESGSVTCYGGGEPADRPFTATIWIDGSGTAAANCSDMHNPQCQPSPRDPQAQRSAVLRFGQLTSIRLDVVDPP
jgi:hypothetical protein